MILNSCVICTFPINSACLSFLLTASNGSQSILKSGSADRSLIPSLRPWKPGFWSARCQRRSRLHLTSWDRLFRLQGQQRSRVRCAWRTQFNDQAASEVAAPFSPSVGNQVVDEQSSTVGNWTRHDVLLHINAQGPLHLFLLEHDVPRSSVATLVRRHAPSSVPTFHNLEGRTRTT